MLRNYLYEPYKRKHRAYWTWISLTVIIVMRQWLNVKQFILYSKAWTKCREDFPLQNAVNVFYREIVSTSCLAAGLRLYNQKHSPGCLIHPWLSCSSFLIPPFKPLPVLLKGSCHRVGCPQVAFHSEKYTRFILITNGIETQALHLMLIKWIKRISRYYKILLIYSKAVVYIREIGGYILLFYFTF